MFGGDFNLPRIDDVKNPLLSARRRMENRRSRSRGSSSRISCYSNLAMPRKPGMEALREFAELKLPVHVILLTAAIQRFEVTRALQLAARGVVLKAFPPELLLESIRAVSEGQHWVASEVFSDWARIAKEPTGAPTLTSREIEFVSAVRSGSSNREIAQKLSIIEETLKRHLSNIFAKLGVSSRLEMALLASRHNLGT